MRRRERPVQVGEREVRQPQPAAATPLFRGVAPRQRAQEGERERAAALLGAQHDARRVPAPQQRHSAREEVGRRERERTAECTSGRRACV